MRPTSSSCFDKAIALIHGLGGALHSGYSGGPAVTCSGPSTQLPHFTQHPRLALPNRRGSYCPLVALLLQLVPLCPLPAPAAAGPASDWEPPERVTFNTHWDRGALEALSVTCTGEAHAMWEQLVLHLESSDTVPLPGAPVARRGRDGVRPFAEAKASPDPHYPPPAC